MIFASELLSNDWFKFGVFLAGIFLLLGLSELARLKLHWSPGTTRKLIHIIVGCIILLCPFIFGSPNPPMVLAVIFIIVNLIALKKEKLSGIHGTSRKSYGTVYFPIAFLILVLFWWDNIVVFEISLLLLTFADTAATIAGENSKSPKAYIGWKDIKSFQGTITMFIVSVLLTGFGTLIFTNLIGKELPNLESIVFLSLFIGILATLAESFSYAGSDNLSVPLAAAVGYDLFVSYSTGGELIHLLGWGLLPFVLSLIAVKLKTLTKNGAAGAWLIGLFVFAMGGIKFAIPLFLFFTSSSLLSRIGGKIKEENLSQSAKIINRDIAQVLANGIVPLVLTIVWFYTPSELWYAAYIATVAAATADTWATEIGFFARSSPRNCINFKKVEKGTSGGITLLGTIGSILGSIVIVVSADLFIEDNTLILLLILGGFLGSVVDSIAGSTIQAVYICSQCGKTTELSNHCKKPANLIKGNRFINNDVVNILCTLGGGLSIFILRSF